MSAETIVPIVLGYVSPQSVIDIGCGTGTWLTAWKKQGIKDVLGVDGDYVKRDKLLVDQQEFIAHDLSTAFKPNRKYDIVTSLEVGEHIDPAHADTYVQTICDLSDVVLFSAAIPGQEGTFHINEQYPSYWASIFSKKGFVAIDCLREKIWDNNNVSWWYRQNILFFVREKALASYPALQQAHKAKGGNVPSLVHPELLKWKDDRLRYFQKNLHNPFRTVIYFGKKLVGK
jgi:hypothetical protein